MVEDVVDVGADGRQHVDARQVLRGAGEALVHAFPADHQHLAVPARLVEVALQRLRLGVLQLQAVEDDEAILRLAAERHLQAKRADLLVERLLELALARAVRLPAADEDRGGAGTMASHAAALLLAELLAGAIDVGTLLRRTGRAARVLALPRHHAVQDVGTRLDAEDGIVEFHVAGSLAVEFLDLHLHGDQPSSFLSLASAGGVPLSVPAPASC